VKEKYIQTYSTQYNVSVPNWRQLEGAFNEMITEYGISARMPVYSDKIATQMSLFDQV
jgi:hypothetical protein